MYYILVRWNHVTHFRFYVFNPLLPDIPFLCPLKTLENRRFSDVFIGYKKGALGSNGLRNIKVEHWLDLFSKIFFVIDGVSLNSTKTIISVSVSFCLEEFSYFRFPRMFGPFRMFREFIDRLYRLKLVSIRIELNSFMVKHIWITQLVNSSLKRNLIYFKKSKVAK